MSSFVNTGCLGYIQNNFFMKKKTNLHESHFLFFDFFFYCRYFQNGKIAAVGQRLQPPPAPQPHAVHAATPPRRRAFSPPVARDAAQSGETRRLRHQEPGDAHHGGHRQVTLRFINFNS